MSDPDGGVLDAFRKFMDRWNSRTAARDKAEREAPKVGCQHSNLPVKYDSEAAKGKGDAWVREHYPRFFGPCPDCGERMIGYASFEHYVAGDW